MKTLATNTNGETIFFLIFVFDVFISFRKNETKQEFNNITKCRFIFSPYFFVNKIENIKGNLNIPVEFASNFCRTITVTHIEYGNYLIRKIISNQDEFSFDQGNNSIEHDDIELFLDLFVALTHKINPNKFSNFHNGKHHIDIKYVFSFVTDASNFVNVYNTIRDNS